MTIPGHLEGCDGKNNCHCLSRLRETPFDERSSPMEPKTKRIRPARGAIMPKQDHIDDQAVAISSRDKQTSDFTRITMEISDPGQVAAFLEQVAHRIRKRGSVVITIE